MTFSLKNVGATYQKAIQRCLQGQIGRNAEAYVDDIIVKTKRKISSLRISPRHLKILGNSNGSSTRPSVCSVSRPENYSA